MTALNVLELFQRFGLKQIKDAGDNVIACCPFHEESRPSFGMNKEGLFNCFSCNAKGNLKDFLKHFGEEELKLSMAEEVAFILNSKLVKENNLNLPEYAFVPVKLDKEGIEYLKMRGVSEQLAIEKRIGSDPFGIIIPIIQYGKIVGMVKRLYDGKIKYLYNKSFPKSKVLYNLDDAVKRQDCVFVVEGVFDCLRLLSYNVNAVSIFGKDVSAVQCELLKQFDKIVLALDNDEAGRLGNDILRRKLENYTKIINVYYPEGKKDFGEISREELGSIIFESNLQREILLKMKQRGEGW